MVFTNNNLDFYNSYTYALFYYDLKQKPRIININLITKTHLLLLETFSRL